MSIQDTLDERQKQHGDFTAHARIEADLRNVMAQHENYLSAVQHVGLGMILHKIARILNEGHAHVDTWHDIAGYATLVEQNMMAKHFAELNLQPDTEQDLDPEPAFDEVEPAPQFYPTAELPIEPEPSPVLTPCPDCGLLTSHTVDCAYDDIPF